MRASLESGLGTRAPVQLAFGPLVPFSPGFARAPIRNASTSERDFLKGPIRPACTSTEPGASYPWCDAAMVGARRVVQAAPGADRGQRFGHRPEPPQCRHEIAQGAEK